MWLERLTTLIRTSERHVTVKGGEKHGVNTVLSALADTGTTAWVWLDTPDTLDDVSLGNALASAVNRAVNSVYLSMALPFTYHLEVLKSQPVIMDGLTIAVSHANTAPTFSEALLRLPPGQCRVVLDWAGVDIPPLDNTLIITPAELALTPDEALLEAPNLAQHTVLELWRATHGQYVAFKNSVHRLTGEDTQHLPTPLGTTYRLSGTDRPVDPDILLEVLITQNRFIEALDLACTAVPHRVKDIIHEAGPVYHERGLHTRLFVLLRSLDPAYLQHETTLEWFFVSAGGSGHLDTTMPIVEKYLSEHEAPQLRARYVGAIPDPAEQQKQAQELATKHPNALTLFQWGRLHPDPHEGVRILKESITLAERYGRPYDTIRNAGVLATRLLHTGKFTAALNWHEWALRKYDLHGLQDGKRRLLIINDWAYTRIILGQLTGLREELWRYQQQLEGVLPDAALTYRSTLAELELVLGNTQTATDLARSNVWQCPRRWAGEYTITLVRALLEENKVSDALKEARMTHDISGLAGPTTQARLALGMVLAFTNPTAATGHLTYVMNNATTPAEHRCTAALHYLLATKQPFTALPKDVQALFNDITRTGLHLFSGPEEVFEPIWRQILQDEAALRINLLGNTEVKLHGEPISLTPFLLDLLAIIALKPNGITLEELHTHLYPDEEKNTRVKSNITRLRKLIPITPAPYRIDISYKVDALEVEELLKQNNARAALSLYRGALLPNSDVLLITERRHYLEDLLQQVVLTSNDPEVLYSYAQETNDITLWEASIPILERNKDPRLPIARATYQRLTRDLNLN